MTIDALNLEGDFALYNDLVDSKQENAWLRDPASPPPPPLKEKVQTGAYKVFVAQEQCRDLPREVSAKLAVTLGSSVSSTLRLRADWFEHLLTFLPHVRQHVSMCAFKTLIGGWTTSHRMHEPVLLPCVFGCSGECDIIGHYLLCSPLWQICSQVLSIEAPLGLGERICVVNPSVERLQLVALCYQVYHYTKTRIKELGGYHSLGSNRAQLIAAESAKTFVNHVR